MDITDIASTDEMKTEQSKNILISIKGNGNALSGNIQLNLDVGVQRFTWLGEINVLELTTVSTSLSSSLTMVDLRPSAWSGSHPAGQS